MRLPSTRALGHHPSLFSSRPISTSLLLRAQASSSPTPTLPLPPPSSSAPSLLPPDVAYEVARKETLWRVFTHKKIGRLLEELGQSLGFEMRPDGTGPSLFELVKVVEIHRSLKEAGISRKDLIAAMHGLGGLFDPDQPSPFITPSPDASGSINSSSTTVVASASPHPPPPITLSTTTLAPPSSPPPVLPDPTSSPSPLLKSTISSLLPSQPSSSSTLNPTSPSSPSSPSPSFAPEPSSTPSPEHPFSSSHSSPPDPTQPTPLVPPPTTSPSSPPLPPSTRDDTLKASDELISKWKHDAAALKTKLHSKTDATEETRATWRRNLAGIQAGIESGRRMAPFGSRERYLIKFREMVALDSQDGRRRFERRRDLVLEKIRSFEKKGTQLYTRERKSRSLERNRFQYVLLEEFARGLVVS